MKYLSLVVSILLTFTAFFFSSQSGESSSAISGSISLYIYHAGEWFFHAVGIDETLFHTIIRKAAHITMYLSLGIAWTLTLSQFHVPLYFALIIGVSVALLDEGIQMFAEERGPSLIDAFLFDFLSFAFSWFWIHKIKHKTQKSPQS